MFVIKVHLLEFVFEILWHTQGCVSAEYSDSAHCNDCRIRVSSFTVIAMGYTANGTNIYTSWLMYLITKWRYTDDRLKTFVNQLSINLLHQTFCMYKAMLPVIVKVNLSMHGCYAYYATAANLDKLCPPVKNFAPQISTSEIRIPIRCKEYICAHMDFRWWFCWYTQNTVEGAQYSITGISYRYNKSIKTLKM